MSILPISSGFEKLGRFTATYAKTCIFAVLALTVIFGGGLIRFGELNDIIQQFTPIDSRSIPERRIANAFLGKDGEPYQASMFVRAKDGGSILRSRHLDGVLALTARLESHIKIRNESNGKMISYMNLCSPNCQQNDLVFILLRTYATNELRYNPNVKLTYPTTEILNNRIYLGTKFYGVTTDDSGFIKDIRLVQLAFEVTVRNATTAKLVKEWDSLMWTIVAKFNEESALLDVVFVSDEMISAEVRRTGISTHPYLSFSFIFVLAFTIGSTLRPTWSESTPLVVLVGVLGPIIGVIGSFGLLIGYFGMSYQPIITVSLFLVLAVGVDDVFLILAAWRRLSDDEMARTGVHSPNKRKVAGSSPYGGINARIFISGRKDLKKINQERETRKDCGDNRTLHFLRSIAHKKETDIELVARRFGLTMAEVGPSITITSLTNALSFATGIFTTTPAIRTFSIFTATAITFTYFVQIFLFGALLSLHGRKKRKCDSSGECEESCWSKLLKDINIRYEIFIKGTASYLASPFSITIFIFVVVIYGYIVTIGWSSMRVDLSADKLFLADSPVLKWRAMEDKYINSEINVVRIFVHSPGDMRRARQLNRIMHMVARFEAADSRHDGSDSTSFWLRSYLDFLSFERPQSKKAHGLVAFNHKFTYSKLLTFLQSDANKMWAQSLDIREEECIEGRASCVKSFAFTTAFRHATTLSIRVKLLDKWRRIADEFADLNVTVFTPFGFLCDQMSSMTNIAVFTVGTTLICMAVICCVFIGGAISVISAVLSVFSVNVGVFGLMALWSIDLDPIALAGLLMAVGFSVDYTAHVSYHFHWTKEKDVTIRLEKALLSIAWPTLQAGLSTLVAVAGMALHESYLVKTFVKTAFIVILLGLIHGLILLPILLTNSIRLVDFISAKCCKPATIVPNDSISCGSVADPESGMKSVTSSMTPSIASSVFLNKSHRFPKQKDIPELPLARIRWTI